jgi:thiosulfate reductase/polysulfide reductase chain A
VLIGSHLGENMHNSQVQEFAKAIERRVPIIVVDPRFSVAASKAKFWLPIKPGTDLALLLAWMNLLVIEGRYDKAFVEQHGHGFEPFAAEIKGYTPDWAAAETGVSAELIRAAAREFASHRPATIVHPGRRVNWYGDDTQRSRAVALLNGLLGNWGRKGGLFVAAGMKVAPYPLPPYPKSDKPRADGADAVQYPFADEGITTSIRDATLSDKPYPIKGWFVYSTNLMQALPNRQETLKAIDKLDLLVVCETIPSEMAGYADVILPDTTFLERHDDLLVGFGRIGWTSLRQPVVAAPHDQKPSWWIAKELAGKLGIPKSMPFKDIPRRLCGQVHLLPSPREGGEGPGLRLGVPDTLHELRRPRRREERGQRAAAHAPEPHVAARGRYRAPRLLPDLRSSTPCSRPTPPATTRLSTRTCPSGAGRFLSTCSSAASWPA